MPAFYFHLRTPIGLEIDDKGLDLADFEHAYLEAYRAVPTVAADLVLENCNPYRCAFVIADAAGRTLDELPFAEVFYTE